MIVNHSDSLEFIAENFKSRIKHIEYEIQTVSKYAFLKKEDKKYLRISLYFIIKNGYHVHVTEQNKIYYYRIEEKQYITTRADINEGTKSLRTLFKGYSHPLDYPILFRLCIALSLSVEESYDWFRICGIDLSSDIPEFEKLGNLIQKYCHHENI